jgi:hypothetical protein
VKANVATLALSFIIGAVGALVVPSSYAQGPDATATGTQHAPQMTKEQKKAARKQARAKKNAELKKLEGAGYNPAGGSDLNYPQNLQNAQKKAGVGSGASQ